MAKGKKLPVPPTLWPEAIPGINEEKFLSLGIGNTHLSWAVHEGAGSDFSPTLFWRTPHFNPKEGKDASPSEVLSTYLTEPGKDLLFGNKSANPNKEAAVRAAVERRVSIATVYVVSTNDEQLESFSQLMRDMPCRIYLMQSDDFFTAEQGRYAGLGIDRLANLRAATDYRGLQGFPTLVFDGGTAMTYTAVDANGKILGGGIAPGISVKLTSLRDYTSAFSNLSTDELRKDLEDLVDAKGKTVKTLPLFARTPKQNILTSLCREIATSAHAVIQGFLAKVDGVGGASTNDGNDQPLPEEKTEEENDGKGKETEEKKTEPSILVTGGDMELIARLLEPDCANLIELEPARKTPLSGGYTVKRMKHMIHYGITSALRLRASDAKSSPTAEMDNLIIGQRVAKKFPEKDEYGEFVYRGTVACVHPHATSKYPYAIRYDDGDAEDMSPTQLYDALELYIKVGERDPETSSAAVSAKTAGAKEAVAFLAEKDDVVKASIEKKKAKQKASAPPPLSLVTEPVAVAAASGSTVSSSKRSPAEEETDSRKKAKPSPKKFTKAKKEYEGDRIAKYFEGSDEPYFGIVQEFWYDDNDEVELWNIVYDDGDTEDLQEDEFLEVVELYEKKKGSDPRRS